MNEQDRVKLLFGPYRPPALKKGDRATCLFRDCEAVITGWTDALIPWPRCRALEGSRGGGSGLLVDEELARAIRHESAAAICYWWRVCSGAVWRWRKALGVTKVNNEGSQRLVRAAAELGAEAMKDMEWSGEERERRRQWAIDLDKQRFLIKGYHGRWWTPEEIALLGTMPDQKVARKVKRSVEAVHSKRERLGILNPSPSPRCGPRQVDPGRGRDGPHPAARGDRKKDRQNHESCLPATAPAGSQVVQGELARQVLSAIGGLVMGLEFPSSDESHERLKNAGWSVGFVGYDLGWQVDGTNGENRIQAYGLTLDEAYWRACEQAGAAGRLSQSARKD